MFDKLKDIEAKYVEVERALSDPTQISNPQRLQSLAKTHAELAPIVSTFKEYQKVQAEAAEVLSLMQEETEEDLVELAKGEYELLTKQKEQLEQQLQLLMLPKDSNDEKNVITEIRAGTGGEEASLFAAELFRMYSRYAERQGWKIEILNANETGLKGFKEVIFSLQGDRAYSKLKFEGGIHRVQRVPATEGSGRIHTSAVSVAVLPEAEEVDLVLEPSDIRIDLYRSSGPGWPERQYDRLGGADYPLADRSCRYLPR